MKKIFTILAVSAAAVSLIGCGPKNEGPNYELKARTWICDQVDHFACPDEARHSLYYLANFLCEKVDLNDNSKSIISSITCSDNSIYNFYSIDSFSLPADKGYAGSTSFLVVVRDDSKANGEQEAAIVFNTDGTPHKKICHGNYVKLHGYSLVSRCHITGGSISGVDVFDIDGNKLEPKVYEGTIARQNVVAEIVEKDGYIVGSYYYTKYGPGKHRLYIYGTIDNERKFDIEGENYSAYSDLFNCEDWAGTLTEGKIDGAAYINHSGRTYEFTLTEKK